MSTEITKDFVISAAHRLLHHEGHCHHLHGHNWKISITIKAKPDKVTGMIVDFKELKRIIEDSILTLLDHTTILNTEDTSLVTLFTQAGEDFLRFPGEPTCENLSDWIAHVAQKILRNRKLHRLIVTKVVVEETPGSRATWRKE